MLDKLINDHGGLYNRVTYEIKLSPFTLRECEELLESNNVALSRYDIVQAYMALGGIPYYLGYFEGGKSLAQNVDAFFSARVPSSATSLTGCSPPCSSTRTRRSRSCGYSTREAPVLRAAR